MAKRTLSAAQKAALARGRKVRAKSIAKRTVNLRKRRKAKRSASTHKGPANMPYALIANPRKRRRRKATNPKRRVRRHKAKRARNPKRRRTARALARRTHPTVTVINPKRRRRGRRVRNPSGSQIMESLKESALPSMVGAGAGFGLAVLDTKVLHHKPMFSLISKVGLAMCANVILAGHQRVAHAISAAAMASVGYSMGIKTMGGMVAMDQGAMLQGMAAMAEEDAGFAALLQDAGVGTLLTGVDPGMGAAETNAANDYADALGDGEDGYGIGDGEEE